jgi:aspartate aminotransferase
MVIDQAIRVSRRGRTAPPSPVRKLTPFASAAEARGVSVLHVNIGQPDIPTPRPILDAIRAYDDEVLPYAPSRGYPEALSAWSAYYHAQSFDVDPDQLIVTTGGSEALWFAFMAVADEGEEIIVFEPTYANYFGFAASTGVQPVAVPSHPEDGFHLPSVTAIEASISPRTRAICLCNPNNPTGTVYSRGEVEALINLAVKHDLFLISDETYRELVFDGATCTGVLSFDAPEIARRTIVVDSVSKRFSATGARVGCLVSRNPDVMDAVGRFAQARLSTPTVEQLAVVPMLNNPIEYTTWLRGVYENRRNVVFERLHTVGLRCQKPEGAFYVMVDLPVDDCDDFAMWLLSDFQRDGETVMIAPGAGFYFTPGAGTSQARLAYVLNEERLGRAVDLLGHALSVYPGARA